MIADWAEIRLGDHVDLLSGFAFKSKGFTDTSTDIPLVKGSNVHQGFVDWEGAVRWPKEQFNELKKYHLKAGDVVLAMDRPWIEAGLKYAWIKENDPKSMLVQRVSRLRGINGLCSRYLRYVIGSPQFTNYIKPIVTGVNVPHISGSQIKDFKFNLPPKHYQETAGHILEQYDNLIENNSSRIAILEKMAQSLYHEWFVKFRFPGHERCQMVDSPLGMIPGGWEIVSLEDICSKITDGAHKSPKSVELGVPMASVKDMHDFGFNLSKCRQISEEDYEELKRQDSVVKQNDILIAKDGSYLKHSFVVEKDIKMALLSSIAMLRPSEQIKPHWLSYCLRSPHVKSRMKQCVSGVAIPRIILKDFRKFQVILPPYNLQSEWNDKVEPMVKLCWKLIAKNENLKTQRDLILPKLISGQIDLG